MTHCTQYTVHRGRGGQAGRERVITNFIMVAAAAVLT